MYKAKIIVALTVLLTGYACNNAQNKEQLETLAKESKADSKLSSVAAEENNKDTTRKFIRTADIKFKVKNVADATYNIEDVVRKNAGFVTYTKLESIISNTTLTPVSSDSSVETTYYNVVNTITLRVPNTALDTTLKDISKNIDYLDSRTIIAEDVALQILSNKLVQKRIAKNEQRLTNAVDTKGKKLSETSVAEDLLLNKQEESDNAFIKNLSLNDQVNYSTVTIYLYQRETIKREVIANTKNISAYEQSFGSKILDELKKRWYVLAEIILLVTRLWGLILAGVVAFLLYKKYGNRLKK